MNSHNLMFSKEEQDWKTDWPLPFQLQWGYIDKFHVNSKTLSVFYISIFALSFLFCLLMGVIIFIRRGCCATYAHLLIIIVIVILIITIIIVIIFIRRGWCATYAHPSSSGSYFPLCWLGQMTSGHWFSFDISLHITHFGCHQYQATIKLQYTCLPYFL